MKAIVYNGPHDVSVRNVTYALVRVTTTNICGSALHMYEGCTSFEDGRILGHENLGEVIEVGAGVDRVKVGDIVCLPFDIGCSFCENCEKDPCCRQWAYSHRCFHDQSSCAGNNRNVRLIRGPSVC